MHGTAQGVDAFDLNHPGRKDVGWLGDGVYLTSSPWVADEYARIKAGGKKSSPGQQIMPLYAALHSPFVAPAKIKERLRGRSKEEVRAWTQKLKGAGHDGVVLTFPGGAQEFVVFDPGQVKSATGNTGAFSADTARLSYALGEKQSARGMAVDQVRGVVDEVSGEWGNAPKVHVVQALEDLPRDILNAVRKAGSEGTVDALYVDGKAYIVADRMTDADHVRRSLLHEGVGHHGLRLIMPEAELNRELDRAWTSRHVQAAARELSELYDFDLSDLDQRRMAVEEVLANMAEEGRDSLALDRFVSAVMRAIRRIFPNLKMSRAEVRELVARARQAVVDVAGKRGAERAGDVRMSRGEGQPRLMAPNGKPSRLTPEQYAEVRSPEFKEWAGNWEVMSKDSSPVVTAREGKVPSIESVKAVLKSLQGTSVFNEDTGWEIGFGKKGLSKTQTHQAEQLSRLGTRELGSIVKQAVLVATEKNRDEQSSRHVRWVHHFYAPFRFTGRMALARVVVKETHQGYKYYDSIISKTKEEFVTGSYTSSQSREAVATNPSLKLSIISLMDMVKEVRPDHVPSIALDENGEPLVRDGQYENTETGEKRAVGSFGPDAGGIRFKRGKASAASVAQSLGQANQPMTQAEIASMLEKNRTFANKVHEGRDLVRHQVRVTAFPGRS